MNFDGYHNRESTSSFVEITKYQPDDNLFKTILQNCPIPFPQTKMLDVKQMIAVCLWFDCGVFELHSESI